MMNKKMAIIVSAAAVTALAAIIVWQLVAAARLGTLELSLSPNDASVTVDDKQVATANSIKIEPGKHTVQVIRTGFQTQTFDVETKSGQTITKQIILEATSESALRAWQTQNPSQAQEREAKVGKQVTEEGQKITQDNPILNRLPYVTSTFRIDFGVSQKYPNDPHAIALYVTSDGEVGKTNALDWLRSQGYNPENFELIYREGGFGD